MPDDASAAPVTPEFDEIQSTFELLDDWEDRYRYVIELGKDLPAMDDAVKTPATKVDGCASQVWLDIAIREEDGAPRLFFVGDSDAHIVRGLIAILRALLNGQPAAVVAKSDPAHNFASLGLDKQLSSQRSNGLNAMVRRIRAEAAMK